MNPNFGSTLFRYNKPIVTPHCIISRANFASTLNTTIDAFSPKWRTLSGCDGKLGIKVSIVTNYII